MNFLDAIILGIVEGITEFLPISSTGHLILADKILGIPETEFLKSFEIIIQLGAITAVIFLYFKVFFRIKDLAKVIIGTIPAGVIGLLFYDLIKTNLLGSEKVVIISMLIGGILIILFEKAYRIPDRENEEVYEITYKQSFFVGLFQVLAIIPGVSRSASTIIGGLLLGIPRRSIVEFSFLLAVPAILGASLIDIYSNPTVLSGSNLTLLLAGFVTAFIVAIVSIKFLLRFIKTNNFIPFGVYRILLALVFFFLVI